MNNTFLTQQAMSNLSKMLTLSNKKIVNLSFESCFMDGRAVYELSKGLAVNRTLVSISLAGNRLSSGVGNKIIQSLKVN